MLRRFLVMLVPCLVLGAAAGPVSRGQTLVTEPTAPEVPRAVAVFGDAVPVLDGDVLNDAAWTHIPPLTGFWQTTPDEGRPASERTEVRLLYTETALYVGVVCFDREPARIIVSDSRRDASLDETDSFRFILDTYRDGQSGFVFGTNPAGIEYDAQVSTEGQGSFGGGRQQAGSGGGFNINWDGAWNVRTRISETGWSAEFEIPFRTLRFPRGRQQTWGVNFQRSIRRRNEDAYWAKLPRQYDLNRVSRAGRLDSLVVPNPRNLKVTPYVLGQSTRDFTLDDDASDTAGDFGVDVKYSLTPSLTLDATYNTDFAQVEVDEQQVNLDRFSLFFPEKRPFFLENAGLFSVGESGEVELFFSRRIGLGPNGEAIPILGGGRVSGQVGGLNVGLLTMQTESVRGVAPTNNFAVARIRKDLPNRSSAGVLFTNRLGTGGQAPDEDHNQTFALDGRLGLGRYGQVAGFAAMTNTPGRDGPAHAFNLEARYDSEAWLLNASYTEVARDFNPEVGFLRRGSYRKPTFLVFHRIRPQGFLGLHELRPHVSYRGYWDFGGFQETGYLHVDNHWEWKNGYELHTGVNFTREGVKEAFEIVEGVVVPPGTYDHREAQLVGFTNQGARVSLRVDATLGGFFGGDRVTLGPTLRMRASEAFTSEFSLQHNDVRLPGGAFTAMLFRARLSYAFTPRLYVQSLVQYNDQADLWSANLRLGWIRTANTGLFVVFNQTNGLDGLPGDPQSRSVTVKYSHLFDVLR